jgi:hypothetical protein
MFSKGRWMLFLFFSGPSLLGRDCAELNRLWRDYYYLDFGITWSLGREFKCPSESSQIAEAFYHLHNPVFKKRDFLSTPNFYGFARDRIDQTVFVEVYDGSDAAIKDGRLEIYLGFFDKTTRERRSAIIVHETSHFLPSDPGHEDCVRNKVPATEPSQCDARFFSAHPKGSGYNFEVNYLAWVRNGASYHELRKWVIQAEINALVPDRFNEITPEEIKEWRRE